MDNQIFTSTRSIEDLEVERSFKRSTVNATFEAIQQKSNIEFKNLPTYQYQTIDFSVRKQKQNFQSKQQMEIKSPQSSMQFTKINFNQRAGSAVDFFQSNPTIKQERMKFMYEDIIFGKRKYEFLSPETQGTKVSVDQQRQTLFSKYSKGQNGEFNRIKSNSQFFLPKQDTFNFNSYKSSSINGINSSQKANYFQKVGQQKSNQIQQYRKKVIGLQRELTQMSLQKGELIIQVAELQRQNSDLKRQLRKADENKSILNTTTNINPGNKKIQIDEDLLYQIQNISQQQKQINKIKEEYIQLASVGYQTQIKKLLQLNNAFKLEIQSLKIDLEMAKQDLKQKQLKIQFLQKEKNNFEQKKSNNSKMPLQTNERHNQVMALKHTLNALQTKYRALSRELANKEDYILKYITNRRASQDLQAIKRLVSQNEPFGMRQSDHISHVESQFQTSSQVHSIGMKSSKQL